jgi:plastocyanin
MFTPLEVRVRKNGAYAAGVRVFWRTESGRVQPSVSVTDERGSATSEWTLGESLGPVLATASTDETSSASGITFRTVAYEPQSVVVDSATSGQRATVGTALPRRLRLHVRNAAGPRAGVTVYWSATGGVINARSVTDENGWAEAEWQLPTIAAPVHRAYAVVPGFSQRMVSFSAEALAGPVARLTVHNGIERVVSSKAFSVAPLVVGALDAFGNRVRGAPVIWSVVNGPITLKSGATSLTDYLGLAEAVIAPQGLEGAAIVRATSGTDLVEFRVRVAPGETRVMLDTRTGRGWQSSQNGSQPAQDSIRVGETVVFGLSLFDYDNHNVVSIGEPAFEGGGEFPYANPSEVRITFTKPGLYRYADGHTGAIGAVLVVSRNDP